MNNPSIAWANTTQKDSVITALGGKTLTSVVRVFTTSGTWTKPAGLKDVYVVCIGGGSGGYSGARQPTGAASIGGFGGGSGGWSEGTFAAEALGATETITVGTGGLGGASVTTDTTGSTAGASGSFSSFGNFVWANGAVTTNGGSGSFTGTKSSTVLTTADTPIGTPQPGLVPGAGGAGASISISDVPFQQIRTVGPGDAASGNTYAWFNAGQTGVNGLSRASGDVRGGDGGSGGSVGLQLSNELLPPGILQTNINWTLPTGFTVARGQLVGNTGAAEAAEFDLTNIVAAGETYILSVTCDEYISGTWNIAFSNGTQFYQPILERTDSNLSIIINPTTAFTGNAFLRMSGYNFKGKLSNISLKQITGINGNGYNGGNGGFPGGGGGGGGAARNGFTSGAGGNGANGVVIVIEGF